MTARDELLDLLTAERYTNLWWTTRPAAKPPARPTDAPVYADDEITTARRRKALDAAFRASAETRKTG